MLEFIKVIILGIIEGVTEWLPISSTGHMILIDTLIPLKVSSDFRSLFLVVIQLGAMIAVVVLYFQRLNPFSSRKKPAARKATLLLWAKIAIACVPAALLGFLFNDWIDAHFFNAYVVAAALIIYGIAFIVIERRNRFVKATIEKVQDISYLTALYIGMIQVLSLVPGTSRSGATILGAILLGCSRGVAAEFSFFLGIPVIFGASLLKIVKINFDIAPHEIFYLIFGMVVAFFMSAYSIKYFLGYIKKHDYTAFGYYRIVLGVIVLILMAIMALIG
jgi:undecaprenyl-diphosphatase